MDMLLDETGDLDFSNGDFVIGDSNQQNVGLILKSFMGSFKEYPFIGFGLQKYLKSTVTPVRFKRELKIQLNYDGYDNPNIEFSNGQLKIDI